ncbi:hypothetical protein [Paludibacterium yongneupense]|uniref:hypothetical protein n=1 Tax=Paludibacterium yongneupense TaxID=400061 RepID=UPI0004117D91|nr:hypothetical protein [Paludibacterium yongneupense]
MLLIRAYRPPSADNLQRLKSRLGLSGVRMAHLAGLTRDSQWRKYTGGKVVRHMNMHMLFFLAAQLTLNAQQLAAIIEIMREAGAGIDLDADAGVGEEARARRNSHTP